MENEDGKISEEEREKFFLLLMEIRKILDASCAKGMNRHLCIEILLYDLMGVIALKFIRNKKKPSEFVSYIEQIMKDVWKIAKEDEDGSS